MNSFTGSYQNKNSILHRTNAILKFCVFLVMIALTIVCANVLPLYWPRAVGFVCLFIIAFIFLKLASLTIKEALMPLRRMLWFFITLFLMNFCFMGGEKPFFKWWIFAPSIEGLTQGLITILTVIVILLYGAVLNSTTKPMELTNAIEVLITPLKFVKIPTQLVALILSVAIQFIPTLFKESDTIKKAQMARGARYDSKNIFLRAKHVLPLVTQIFIAAFRRADELSMAMESRGYKS